jgi:hypothetical protein
MVALLALSVGALLVHGYHPWVEDSEIYLPGVEKILHPELFPFGAQFFQSHAHLTLFPNLIAASERITRLPFEVLLLVWHLLSIFLFLLACWELTGKCFTNVQARWAGVTLLAALLTLPVAGTALYIMDQYVNPRNLNVFATIFAIAKVLDRKYVQAGLFLALAATIHPLMPAFAASYCVLLVVMQKWQPGLAGFGGLVWLGAAQAPSPAYHEVAMSRSYFYLTHWEWYEWLGAVAPLAVLWWFGRVAGRKSWRNVELMCRALIIYGMVYLVAGLVVSIPARFESLARLQPMRSLYLLYILLILIGGGFLGEFVLQNRVWRWLALFVPLCLGMYMVQRGLFPASAHIEWPGAAPKNSWVQAFVWIRHNTPKDAVFALDPYHMKIAGEDENGFRAIAERSMLADAVKDSGAVSMFPPMAEEWFKQVQAQREWKKFGVEDFQRLRAEFGVSWVVLEQPGVAGLTCPYENQAVRVCRLN